MVSFKSTFPPVRRRCPLSSSSAWIFSKVLMSKRLRRWSSSGQVSAPTTPSPTDFSYQSPNLTTPTSVPSNDYGYDDYDDDDQRWSEVIPPKAALTFAPVWDPDHDTVRFSGAQLLNLNESSEEERISPTDACSQVLTVGHSTLPLSEPTSTLQFFQDHYDYLFSSRSGAQSRQSWERGGDRERRKKVGRTQTSSTLDGLDVYLRGSLMLNNNNDDRRHGKDERYFSCLEYLDQDFDFDPRTSFAKKYFQDFSEDNNNDKDALSSSSSSSSVSDGNVSDEGFFEVSDLTRCGQRHEREGAARTRDKNPGPPPPPPPPPTPPS
ncbi:hypothetical protein K435DRAFT_794829 [Dendrothele bispora CBS 962.96]|uniref:Uncharacterized protein n=1 Tax=Dendrothele bispora (strain CBS 962.96) TaxID=1314807 RepID=A0A4S8MAT9_DENBC|nr:hypothetical protein K435DRAFT_794829 [Dendrothele bispora CBS 962.96]